MDQASETVWCGARNGRSLSSPARGGSSPATEWTLLTSTKSLKSYRRKRASRSTLAAITYSPNIDPSFSRDEVTDKDIATADQKLTTKFNDRQELREVTCPHCGEDFGIDQ